MDDAVFVEPLPTPLPPIAFGKSAAEASVAEFAGKRAANESDVTSVERSLFEAAATAAAAAGLMVDFGFDFAFDLSALPPPADGTGSRCSPSVTPIASMVAWPLSRFAC